jgi:selenophosphate synthase
MKGSRIHGIVRELGNENIDVINYTQNTQLFITRALSPAKVSTVKIDEENKKAEVFLKIEEVSKAIGRNGQNIKLASQLTGYELDVIREGIVQEEDLAAAVKQMSTLNILGEKLGKLTYVKALTDVTGFGLFGHLIEMCDGSKVSSEIDMDKLPLLANIDLYLEQKCFPGGTSRNWASYGHRIHNEISERNRLIGADPQTSGGLLIAVDAKNQGDFERFMLENELNLPLIGKTIPQKEQAIYLKP